LASRITNHVSGTQQATSPFTGLLQ
jgi:hypothetical protein